MVWIREDLQDLVLAGLREALGEPDADQAAFVAVGRVASALRSDAPSKARFLNRWEEPSSSGALDLTPAYIAVGRVVEPEFDTLDASRFADLCIRALELRFEGKTGVVSRAEATVVANAIALTLAEHHGESTSTSEVVGDLLERLGESTGWRDRVERLTSADRSMLSKSLEQTRWTSAQVEEWRRVGLARLARGWESGAVSVDEPVWVRVSDAHEKWRSALSSVFSVEIEDMECTAIDSAPQRPKRRFEPPPTTRYDSYAQWERTAEERLLSSVRSTLKNLARSRVDLARNGLDAVALELLRFVLDDPQTLPTSDQLAEVLTRHPAVFEVRCSQNDLAAHLDGVVDAARRARQS